MSKFMWVTLVLIDHSSLHFGRFGVVCLGESSKYPKLLHQAGLRKLYPAKGGNRLHGGVILERNTQL